MNERKKSGYLVLGYACNQRCRCCPLMHKEEQQAFVDMEALFREIDRMSYFGVTDITLSGGEPTLHPHFFDIIRYCFDKRMSVHILSNGEYFCKKNFSEKLTSLARQGELSVTTTFHSENPQEHEYQNGSLGSFARSIAGLKMLDSNGVNVSVKHCITADNYRQLPSFVEYVLKTFSANAEIQLWGVDLCGIDTELACQMFVPFQRIGPFLEEAIDLFEKDETFGRRMFTVNNLPLCTCDCYYWRYFSSLDDDTYIDHTAGGKKWGAESGPVSKNCERCSFVSICMGAYYSNFNLMGDDIVAPPKAEMLLSRFCSVYRMYRTETLGKVYFTPYVIGNLRSRGFELTNYLSEESIVIRAHARQLVSLCGMLRAGAQIDTLEEWLREEGLESGDLLSSMQKKGIIE